MSADLPAGEFTNVGRTAWHRTGFLASQTAYVGAALLVLVAVVALVSPAFLSLGNLVNISKNFSYVGIVSLGATLVIITAGIDLSVGSVMALVAVSTALLLQFFNGSPLAAVPGAAMGAAVLGGLLIAALIGLINGYLIAKQELTPFVTTLGMLSVCRSLCYVITGGRGVAIAGHDASLFYALTDGKLFGVPLPLIYLLVLAGGMGLFLHHMRGGRWVFALGGNERAAALTGVPVARVRMAVYTASSLLAGFSGILMAGWLGSVPANLAVGYELRIIAASVIGGANLTGGIGGPTGAVIGAALIEVIRNGLVLGRVNTYWQDTLVGVIIVLAVYVDRLRRRRLAR
jgi:ribose transport system permease protein